MGQIESFSPYKNSVKQLGWQSAGDKLSIPYPQGGFVLLLSRDGEERAAERMPAAQGFPWICIWLQSGVKHPKMMPALVADCREEQYPCTRLYSVHKPCKQCLNEICFYRRVRGAVTLPRPALGESLCFFFGAKPSAFCPPQPPPGLRDQQGDLRPHCVCPRRAAAG